MATGDPTWQCPFCKNIYYGCVTSCNCHLWTEHTNRDRAFFVDKEIVEDIPRKNTLVVNLFAGPGAGKSTICSGIFTELKWKGIECEVASEFAKDLVWEGRDETFRDQIYLFGKQYHRIFRLLGQVDVVICDCPILLSPIYDKEKREEFENLVVSEHLKMWTYNVFIKRMKPYRNKGRIHNEKEAQQIDRQVLDVLDKHYIPFETFEGTPEGLQNIVKKILLLINYVEEKTETTNL